MNDRYLEITGCAGFLDIGNRRSEVYGTLFIFIVNHESDQKRSKSYITGPLLRKLNLNELL